MNERDIERERELIEQADREFANEEFRRIAAANDPTIDVREGLVVREDVPVIPMTHERLQGLVLSEQFSRQAGADHGVWVAYGRGKTRQFGRPGMTIMEAHETRRRVFDKLLAMKKRGAIISATEVGISGGPALWR